MRVHLQIRRTLVLGLAVCALHALVAPPVAAAGGRVRVELYAEVAAARTKLVLGDIARVTADDAEQRRSLERVPICYAPVPGSTRNISRDYVLLKLRQEHIDVSRTEIGGAEVVRIVAVTSTIPASVIEETVKNAIQAAMPWAPEATEIYPPHRLQPLVVQAAAPSLEVRFDDGEDFLGSTMARVHVFADGELRYVTAYRFHVALYRDVYVARQNIARGNLLSVPQLTTERMDVSRLGDRYIADPDAVFGLQAGRSIRKGTRLTPAMVSAPTVVGRGDRVRVNVSGNQFEISAVGEAREAGALDSIIRVDLPNRRRVYARVVAPGLVELVQ